MSTVRLLTAAMALAFAACTFGASEMGPTRMPCNDDSECSGEQVCFPDGCGDPGRDIVVEVVPGAASGQLAQDFAVEKVLPSLDFQAFAPPVIQGVITQDSSNSSELPYNGEVSVRVTGESLLIPGRSRSFQYTVQPDQGAYQVPVASGHYALTFTPAEPVLPPRQLSGQTVNPGDVHEINERFPAISSLMRIDGRLVLTAESNAVPQTAMEIQALDPVTSAPLSQRSRVSSGQLTSTGDFYLYIEQGAGNGDVLLRATPKESTALVPSKTFVISLANRMTGPLELGDYGAPVNVSGRIVDELGRPVAGATVLLEGKVNGGGTFKCQRSSTASDGTFSLQTLPSAPSEALTLVAVPPAESEAAPLRVDVPVSAAAPILGDFVAPQKIVVGGNLFRPDSNPATQVIVRAEPVAKLDDHPLPSATTEGATDDFGSFALKLAPAIYRLDFVPSDFNPRVSRFVIVRPTTGSMGESVMAPIQLPDFSLSRGRTVTGTISSIPAQLSINQTPVPAPNAAVKFFKVVSFEGKLSHVLLAEGLADSTGSYKVVLPTR